MAADSELEQIPSRSKGDHAHSLVKAVAGGFPIVGSAASELFQAIVTPPLERRRDEWMASVGERIQLLEERHDINAENLADNPEFIDTVIQASRIALGTSQAEKLDALRNAVFNSATPSSPDAADRQMFLSLIERFTHWHIRLLLLFDNPSTWFDTHKMKGPSGTMGGSLSQVLTAAFSELKDQRDFYDQIGKDLHSSGLFSTDSLHSMMTTSGLYSQRTTDRGRAFLEFISDPGQSENA